MLLTKMTRAAHVKFTLNAVLFRQNPTSNEQKGAVKKNITAGLAYWDIFKNYHANKQEEYAYQISKTTNVIGASIAGEEVNIGPNGYIYKPLAEEDNVVIRFENESTNNPEASAISIKLKTATGNINVSIEDISKEYSTTNKEIQFAATNIPKNKYITRITYNKINLQRFLLSNLDDMREHILKNTGANNEFIIDETEALYLVLIKSPRCS